VAHDDPSALLDATDRSLLGQLRDNGRATVRAVADKLGLPESTVRGRFNALFSQGIVRSTVLVHPGVVGQRLITFVRLQVDPAAWEQVAASHVLGGAPWLARTIDSSAILTQLGVADVADVRDLVRAGNALEGVHRAEVRIVLGISLGQNAHTSLGARVGPWPTPPGRAVDDTDRRLIELLRQDGRASFTALSQQVGLTVAGTRRRVLKLAEDDLVRFVTVFDDGRPEVNADVHLVLAADRRDEVLDFVAAHPAVRYVAETAGSYDVSLFLAATDDEELDRAVDELTSVPGALAHEFVRLEVVRDRVGWDSFTV